MPIFYASMAIAARAGYSIKFYKKKVSSGSKVIIATHSIPNPANLIS